MIILNRLLLAISLTSSLSVIGLPLADDLRHLQKRSTSDRLAGYCTSWYQSLGLEANKECCLHVQTRDYTLPRYNLICLFKRMKEKKGRARRMFCSLYYLLSR